MKIKLPTMKCKRCGHKWHPKKEKMPLRCGGCKTPYWNNPLTLKYYTARNKAIAEVQKEKYAGSIPILAKENILCVDCGKKAIHYEHRDYKKPLSIEPVCASCNAKRGMAKY